MSINFVDQANTANNYTAPPPSYHLCTVYILHVKVTEIKNIMNIDVLNQKIINSKSGAKYQILNMYQVIFAV